MPFEPGTRVRVIEDARIFPEHPHQGTFSHYAGFEGVVCTDQPQRGWELTVDFGSGHGVSVMEYELMVLPPVVYEEDGKSRFRSFQVSVAYEDSSPVPHDWIIRIKGTPHVRLGRVVATTATIRATPEGVEELIRRFALRGLYGEFVQNYLTITGAPSEPELVQ